MNISIKKFISTYGVKFGGLYVLAFFLLVTFFSRFHFNALPGDVLIERENFVLYLPFGGALGAATFFLVIFEIYRNLR